MSDFLKGFSQDKYNAKIPSQAESKQTGSKTRSGKAGSKDTGIPADAREEVYEKDPDSVKRNRTKRIFIVSGVLAGCLMIGLLYYFSNLVKLPDFVGGYAEQAQAWAARNNIYIEMEEDYNLQYNRGLVIYQSPYAQQTLFKGRSMKMTVSRGPDPKERIELPDFSMMNVFEIERWIDENRAENVIINTVYDDTVPANRFMRAEFRDPSVTEQNYRREDRMTIFISRGPEELEKNIKVPDFREKPESEASDWAKSAGIKLNIDYAYSDTVRESLIISQNIAPETKIAKNQELTITVSRGRAVYVPSFSGLSMEEALITAAASGMTVHIIEHYHNSVQAGNLITQSVKAGTLLTEGRDTIMLYYSLGRPYIPNLAGKTINEVVQFFAEMNAKKASLSYKFTDVHDGGTPKGTVIINTDAGTSVKTGSTITVTVSLGGRVTVLNYVGEYIDSDYMTAEIERLEAQGLKVVIIEDADSGMESKKIVEQSIEKAGKSIGTTGTIDTADHILILKVAI